MVVLASSPSLLALLSRAERAGVVVEARGDRLVLRGPREAETVIGELAVRKLEVLAALAAAPEPPPTLTSVLADEPPPECVPLLAELRELSGRVNSNWRSYIATAIEGSRHETTTDPVGYLQHAIEWVRQHNAPPQDQGHSDA